MATAVLIDTDMGVDDAVAIALALASPELDVRALVSTGGNVDVQQATRNIARVLESLRPRTLPAVGRGWDQAAGLQDARHVFGADGLGGADLPDGATIAVRDAREVYDEFLAGSPGGRIIAIGPLTNVARVLAERPAELRRIGHLYVMGGALWTKGNVGAAEFNFYRDPSAAAAVLASGLPITLITLDVTRFVTLDESHTAHLAASGTRAGALLSAAMGFPMAHSTDGGPGRFIIHDALAVGALIWPELFVRTQMAVEVEAAGPNAGRTRPRLSRDGAQQVGVLTAVNAVDFLEDLLERLCQEEFVV